MGNFDRGNRRGGGGGRSFGRRDFGGGGRFDRPREMTKVTCSNCGKETEVPFKPTGDRPVYCKECFEKMGGRNDSRPSFKRSEERQGPTNSEQLSEINSKLDQLIKLLSHSQSSGQAPVKEIKKAAEPEKKKKVVKKSVEPTVETPTETSEE